MFRLMWLPEYRMAIDDMDISGWLLHPLVKGKRQDSCSWHDEVVLRIEFEGGQGTTERDIHLLYMVK